MCKLSIIAASLLSLGAAQAQASTISFLGEIHTGNNEFSIYNNSDDGIQIDEVTVTLGSGTVFATNTSDPYLDASIVIEHFAIDGINGDFNISGDEGSQATEIYNTSVLGNEGYSDSLSTDIVDGASTATFNFTDFDPGEAWGIFVDYDNPLDVIEPGADGDTEPGGNLLDGTTIEVWFTAGGEREMLSFAYEVGGGTGKVSFPTDPVPFNGSSTLTTVPVPPAVWLFGSGLLGMVGVARRRKTA